MTLDQLQVLTVILKTGSFRAASQELHRAQSAVSYAIRTLEDELGFPLFDRSQYRPQLTAQGKSFAAKTEEFIAQFEALKSSAKFLELGHEPVIKISVSSLWPMPPLAKVLQDFKKKFPSTDIRIYHDVLSSDQNLLQGSVDLALGEIFNDTQLLVSKELFDVKMIPLCSPQFALARFKGKAKIDEMRKSTQIILRSTLSTNQRSAHIYNPSNTISVGDFLSKKDLLLGALGWGFMPEHLVKEEVRQKKLILTHSEAMNIPMSIAYNPNHAQGPCAQFLWHAFTKK